MSLSLRTIAACHSFLCPLSEVSFGAEPAQSTEAIPAQEIGTKYHIEGEFGPLFTDLTIKGVVVEPPAKRDKGEDDKIVWLDITDLNGKALEKTRNRKKVYTASKFSIGSKVELVVREEGELYKATDPGSNPDRSHIGKVFCALSLHQRRVVDIVPPQ